MLPDDTQDQTILPMDALIATVGDMIPDTAMQSQQRITIIHPRYSSHARQRSLSYSSPPANSAATSFACSCSHHASMQLSLRSEQLSLPPPACSHACSHRIKTAVSHTPPSTPPTLTQHIFRPSTSASNGSISPTLSIEMQPAMAEDGSDPICSQCHGQGILSQAQYDKQEERERKYQDIRKSNHELRKMLDKSTKQLSVLFDQFRKEQETAETSNWKLRELEIALEESRALNFDLMERNHALVTGIKGAGNALAANCSPLDLRLDATTATSNPTRVAKLEKTIEQLCETLEEQEAQIHNLSEHLDSATENNALMTAEVDSLRNQMQKIITRTRRGAISVTAGSSFSRSISEMVEETLLSSPDAEQQKESQAGPSLSTPLASPDASSSTPSLGSISCAPIPPSASVPMVRPSFSHSSIHSPLSTHDFNSPASTSPLPIRCKNLSPPSETTIHPALRADFQLADYMSLPSNPQSPFRKAKRLPRPVTHAWPEQKPIYV